MRRSFALVLAAIALATPFALAAPDDPKEILPLALASGKVGDWVAVKSEMPLLPAISQKPHFITFTIDAIGKEGVTVRSENNLNNDHPRVVFPKGGEAKLPAFLKLVLAKDGEPHATEIRHGGEKRTAIGKGIDCRKVSFHASVGTDGDFECELWLSSDVKSLAIVGMEMRVKKRPVKKGEKAELELTRRFEVVGWGTQEKTLFGQTAFEVIARPAKPDNDTKLPSNPFASAKTGDWVALKGLPKFAPNVKDAPEPTYVTLRTEKADADKANTSIARSDTRAEKNATFLKKEAPALAPFLQAAGLLDDPWVSEMKVEDAPVTYGGKEFACKKISYLSTRSKTNTETVSIKNAVWLCPDVPGYGIVAFETIGERLEFRWEIIGFGSEPEPGKPVRWGQTGEEAEKADKDAKAEKEKNKDPKDPPKDPK